MPAAPTFDVTGDGGPEPASKRLVECSENRPEFYCACSPFVSLAASSPEAFSPTL